MSSSLPSTRRVEENAIGDTSTRAFVCRWVEGNANADIWNWSCGLHRASLQQFPHIALLQDKPKGSSHAAAWFFYLHTGIMCCKCAASHLIYFIHIVFACQATSAAGRCAKSHAFCMLSLSCALDYGYSCLHLLNCHRSAHQPLTGHTLLQSSATPCRHAQKGSFAFLKQSWPSIRPYMSMQHQAEVVTGVSLHLCLLQSLH